MNKKTKIVFMGTPLFAVESLKAIHSLPSVDISAVVSTPNKPAGRGLKITSSDVSKYAELNNLKLLQPKSLKSKLFLKQLKEIDTDIIVVVAFKKLPKEVWSIPRFGTFNLHASLLPDYRGAAPINWAIINGEKETGVTTFLINEEIDAGKILLQKKLTISENDNVGDIYNKLMSIGSNLVVETIEKLISNAIKPIEQPMAINYKLAPKIFPVNCAIDWELSVNKIHDLVRGLSPHPAAWTYFKINNQIKKVKILKGAYTSIDSVYEKPELEIINKDLIVKNKTGVYKIIALQIEGKSMVLADNFINGHKNLTL
ncbi:MAG: methionyl-tRNA formyltransferase [Solirubrobacteraceae bacterium]